MAVTAHITCTTLLSPDSSAEFNYSERGGGQSPWARQKVGKFSDKNRQKLGPLSLSLSLSSSRYLYSAHSLFLSVRHSLYPSESLSPCLLISICLSVRLSLALSNYLSVPSVTPCLFLSVCIPHSFWLVICSSHSQI